jgi:hypothetical protein
VKKQLFIPTVIGFGFPLIMSLLSVSEAAQSQNPNDFTLPVVFQAAGTTSSSIQSTVAARSTGTAAIPASWLRQIRLHRSTFS